jgi:hypothetical protein
VKLVVRMKIHLQKNPKSPTSQKGIMIGILIIQNHVNVGDQQKIAQDCLANIATFLFAALRTDYQMAFMMQDVTDLSCH